MKIELKEGKIRRAFGSDNDIILNIQKKRNFIK